jgi:Pyruvate/2-oxoacid:ferredoxin oxidoreductase delta subunit
MASRPKERKFPNARGDVMVLCPIARKVHCTGCALVKFCPAKTILGDYGKENNSSDGKGEKQTPPSETKPDADPKV